MKGQPQSAESPPEWEGPEAEEIKQRAELEAGRAVNEVGTLYRRLLDVLSRRDWIPDAAFQPQTLPYQASWDEWGRGYGGGTGVRSRATSRRCELPTC